MDQPRINGMQAYCSRTFGFLAGLASYALSSRPLTFLDAGANIGLASMFFAHYIGYDGTIIAVDASPPNFELLKANLQGLVSIVKPVLGAIVPDAQAIPGGTVLFGGRAGDFWAGQVLEAAAQEQEVVHEVPTTSLPQLAVRLPPLRLPSCCLCIMMLIVMSCLFVLPLCCLLPLCHNIVIISWLNWEPAVSD
jgi:FkbM family methyltransferase